MWKIITKGIDSVMGATLSQNRNSMTLEAYEQLSSFNEFSLERDSRNNSEIGFCHKSILAVDDDPQVRRLIYRSFNLNPYTVVCVDDPKEAVDIAIQTSPSLVFLDLPLAGAEDRDGMDCFTALRQRGYNNPIFILAADDSFEQVHRAAQHGASGYFVKGKGRTFWNRLKTLVSNTLNQDCATNINLTAAAVAYLKTRHFTDMDIRLLAEFSRDFGRIKEIANALDCSEYAVRKKFQSIRDRLGAKSQADLARMIGVLSCFRNI